MTRADFSSLGSRRTEDENISGLNIVDLIDTLPDSHKPLVRLMMRNSQGISPKEAAASLGEEEDIIRTLLYDWVQQGYVQEITGVGESRYKILLAPKQGSTFVKTALQSFAPGKPLVLIANPSGDYALRSGETFVLSVTVSNQGNQSALIDVFVDDGGTQTLSQWCIGNIRERLALGSNSSSEVVFEFQVPVDAMPGPYNYLIVVDAPQHYPEDTPIRHAGQLQVLLPVQDAVGANDPTFAIEPITTSLAPAALKPGELLQVTVGVHNRSDRVDRFRLTCPDLQANWFTVRYPEGLDVPGLVTQTDGLALNPGAKGQILLFLNPPLGADAGSYTPSVRLYSANNPNLVMLDVVYLQILPVYLLNVELHTILGKVRRLPGLFELRLINMGNTSREILLKAYSTDEEELCSYTLDTALRILPRETVSLNLRVKPTKWWRRPLYGGGQLINFCVEIEDLQQLPLSPDPPKGILLWEPRPWWQFLLLVLTTLGSIAAIAFLIWWFFFKPPAPPKVVEFTSDANFYEETNGDFIRLNWQIRNPRQIEAIKIANQSADGTVTSEPRTYNFSQGIPKELKEFCNIRPIAQVLVCNHVRTDARKAGNYVFELQIFSKKDKDAASDSRKTQTIRILPLPLPKVVEFYSTKPVYEEVTTDGNNNLSGDKKASGTTNNLTANPAANNPATILLNWKVINPEQLKELKLIGRTPDGTVTSPLKTYNFSQGIPNELKNFCTVQDGLICRNVATDARKAGDYVFELTVVTQKEQGENVISKKTDTIKIQNLQPKIVFFKINNQNVLPKYVLPLNKNLVKFFVISWKVEGSKDIKVELLPAPGTVPLQGSIPYPLSQKPTQETITLKVTSASGQQVERSVTIDIFEPPKAVSSPKPVVPNSPTARSNPPFLRPGSPVLTPASPILPPAPPVSSQTPAGATGAQSPAPGGTQSPAPGGAQSPAPGGTQSPTPGGTPPANPNSPSLSDPGSLSPSELPPQPN